MSQRSKRPLIIAFIVVLLIYLTQLDLLIGPRQQQHSVYSKVPKPIRPVYRSNNTIWISMGLCFDQTAKILGKSHYPYTEVTPLAIKLWKHFRPDAKIYIKVIYTRQGTEDYRALFTENLQNAGADEIEWAPATQAGNLSCVLQSQVSRIFLYQRPYIHPEDVIVTVDVNLFVMGAHILEPIDQFATKNAWIFQYQDTAHIPTGRGETFNENLLALRAKEWSKIVNTTEDLNESFISNKQNFIKLDRNNTWYYDQWITTYGLLYHKICNVPPWSGLWNNPNLEFDPEWDDSDQCWHGNGYKDCNMDIHIVPHGCKWYHFYPFQTFKEHVEKFHELTNHEYDIDWKPPSKKQQKLS